MSQGFVIVLEAAALYKGPDDLHPWPFLTTRWEQRILWSKKLRQVEVLLSQGATVSEATKKISCRQRVWIWRTGWRNAG